MTINGYELPIIDLQRNVFNGLFLSNTISFYVINFICMLGMVILVWRIRHTDDDTFLR